MVCAAMPWQSWHLRCLVGEARGPSWLTRPEGLAALLLAVTVLVFALVRRTTDARRLLAAARERATLALLAAMIWTLRLPFAPDRMPEDLRVVHWHPWHLAGAVGAVVSTVGAFWSWRVVAGWATDRGIRRRYRR